jgi:hypothetical protein
MDEQLARLRTHRNNIGHYRRLLQTKLSDLERQFVERRLSDEQSKYEGLSKATFPIVFKLPKPAYSCVNLEYRSPQDPSPASANGTGVPETCRRPLRLSIDGLLMTNEQGQQFGTLECSRLQSIDAASEISPTN